MSDYRWKGFDHPKIHEMINGGAGPAASTPQAEFWSTLSENLNRISTALHTELGKLNVAWEGTAGENAQGSIVPLQQWATSAESGSEVMKTSAELQGNYVAKARAAVPEPVKVTTPQPSGWAVAGAVLAAVGGNAGPAAAVAAQSADREAQERAQDEAARKAVEAMTTYESSSEWNADTLGTFQAPPDVVMSYPPPQGGFSGGPVDTGNSLNHTTSQQHTQTSSFPQHAGTPTPTPTHTPLPGGGGGIHTPPSSYQPTPPSNYNPTPPSNHIPGPPGPGGPGPYPQPGTQGPYGPGGGPFVSGGMSGPGGADGSRRGGNFGRGGPGLGPNAMDAEGRQPGRGGPGNGMFGEGRGAVGANGNIGGRGAGPAGAGGRRAEGEDDDEHETPSYLLETEDVFGDERMVAPPVIGEKRDQ